MLKSAPRLSSVMAIALACQAAASMGGPVSIDHNGSKISLHWASRPGQYFDIQRSEDLTRWSDLLRGFPADAASPSTTCTFEDKPSGKAFFRIAPPQGKARITHFSISGGIFTLAWSSNPGEHFDIEYSDNLSEWKDLIIGIPASADSATSTRVFAKPASGRFFRVVSAKSKPLISRVAWLGDSITGGETNPDGTCHIGTGRLVHTLLKQRITPVANSIRGDWDFGWSGFTSQQLINGRSDLPGVFPVQWVIRSGADTCVVHVGTNNITWGQSVETIAASIVNVWDALRAVNITTIGTEITPRSGVSSVNTVDAVNKRLKSEAKARGMIFAEWNHIGRLADGTADPYYYMDGLHPNAIAASAKAVYLTNLLERGTTLSPTPAPPPPQNPDWITPNPGMTTTTGGLPDFWQSYPPEGATIEFSTAPSSDGGVPWHQLVVRQPKSAYQGGYLVISAAATLHQGDKFCGTLELESDTDWNFKEVSISIGNVDGNPRDLYVGGRGGINELPGPVSRYQGILRTPAITVAADHSARRYFFIHYSGSGTLRVRNAGILRVP